MKWKWVFPLLLACVLNAQAQKPLVVATTSFLADMTRELGGETVEVRSLLPLGADPHIYDAVPGDALLLAQADLIVENGLNLEGWLSELITQAGKKAQRITATQGITPIGNEEHAGSYDPHAWMDPLLGRQYAQNISLALQQLVPAQTAYLQARLARYDSLLLSTHQQIEQLLAGIPAQRRVIATTHDAFRYFGQRYQMDVISVLGTTTDAEVRTADLQALINTIESRKLPAIFVESTINPKLLQQVAEDAGIRIGGSMYADSMGPEGSGADTYLRMLLHNARTLAEGLGGAATNEQRRLDLLLLGVIALFFLAAFGWLALRIQRPKSGAIPLASSLEVSSLTVAYDNKVVLNHFDLQLAPGKLYGLLGPNGSGKSTLFKSILGLVETDRSHIRLGGLPISELHTHLAYVPQKEEIDWTFPATVYDVVLMGRYPHRRPFESITSADHQLVLEQLRALDIEPLRNKQIGELSGGQQQRVFIARALAQEASWYFLDEPFVGVDITTEEKIMTILRQKVAKGATVVMIHHDLSKAAAYFDAVVLINRRLVAFGPPAEVVTEANILAAFSGTQPLYDQAEQFNLRK
ncbi:MAG: hypothetical protein C0424_04825 [Sphingobacteriaceae bacterium]|nr:hypothetical protein [Sphingobacteriaceae bacterium]